MASTKRLSNRGSGRRAELLAIAGELFATRGFLATTVRDIADAAGILSGSLYHHFDSKESMVDEILREFLDAQRETNEQVLREASDPRAAIAELIRRSFGAMRRYRAAIAIFQNESNYLGGFERFGYLQQAAEDFEWTWTRLLQDGRRAGVFREDLDPKVTYRFMRDMVWTAVHWYDPRGNLTADAITDQYIEILCDGIVSRE